MKCTPPDQTGIQSITLDMTLGSDGSKGVLYVTEQRYELSQNSVAEVRENATNNTTVQSLLDLLESRGRDRYQFNGDGAGCRFWCHTVLGDLERGGFVASGAANRFDLYVTNKNKGNPTRFPLPTPRGSFY